MVRFGALLSFWCLVAAGALAQPYVPPVLAARPAVARWLGALAAHPRPDSLHLVLLTKLAGAVQARNVRAARPALLAAVALARQLRQGDLLAETLLDLADYHTLLAQYDSAASCLRQANRDFTRLHDLGGQMRCLGRRGRIAGQQGQYVASLAYTFQGLGLPRTGDNRRFYTSLQIQLAHTYAEVGNYAEATRYLRTALHEAYHWDYPDRENLAHDALGEVYRQQHQWAAAQKNFALSLHISQRLGFVSLTIGTRLHLARLHEDQGQTAAARALARQVLAQAQAANEPLLVPPAQAMLARLALAQGQLPEALALARRSLEASQRVHALSGVREASAVLVQVYTRQRAYGAALAALQQYDSANDSLIGDVTRRRVALLQFDHQRRSQQAQIRLLTQQNRLQGQQQELDHLRAQRTVGALSALSLLAMLLAGGGLWQVRRRQATREARLRSQLAADLHDEVGTLLSQISMQSQVLQAGLLTDPAGQHRQLGQISEASRTAVRQLNDVVWSLDAHNDTLPQLLDRLRDYAYEVLGPVGVPVEFTLPAQVPARYLSLALRRNLYLIYKEALHNVLKHAPATPRLVVGVALLTSGNLALTLENDAPIGCLPLVPRRSGHGLRNIAARAAAVGGTATSGPRPDGGFVVRVVVPV
ncbi:ATP-binding protein [Hymenobacter baengnokdamensis]|uniref:ATP-binding protein n=1 Tax=Hymenobacter baengnokdamensis TaxID=2615203 RepID=UPI0012465A60|nr:histidine kinase [Hymenobacter baengnokdamensis]